MKRALALILALIMIFAFTACVQQPAAEETSVAPDANVAEEPAEEQSDKITKETATWKLGVTITDLTVPVWADYAESLQKYGAEAGMFVTVVTPNGDAAEQVSQMENFVTDGYDCIVVGAADNEAIGQAAKIVTDQGVAVFSQGFEFANFTAAMLETPQSFGIHTAKMAGEWINETFEDGKCKVLVAGSTANPLMEQRTEGIYNGLAEYAPNAEVVATVYGLNSAEFLPEMENAFTAHPDIDVVVSYCEGGALAAREAAKGMGLGSDKFGIFCTDSGDEIATALYNGDLIRGAISMGGGEYMGKVAIESIVKILSGEEYEERVNFPEIEVHQDDVLEQAEALGYTVLQ